jgi:hypothetical protein
MKRISVITTSVAVFMAASLLLSGCNHESSQENNNSDTTGIINVGHMKNYENLSELADDADLIAIGTVDRTVEVVPDDATRDKENPQAQIRLTRSSFRVEKSIKGDFTDEIIITQTGAAGWAEEPSNPIFETGERCFLFLREEDGIYHLFHPYCRFRIEDDRVSSMNYVLPAGEVRLPKGLSFWRVDLDDFISGVIEAIKSGFVIPDEEPVIYMDLVRIMGGRNYEFSLYEDGTVIYIKEWGLRMSTLENPSVRAWRSGKISEGKMDELTRLFKTEEFISLGEPLDYPVPGFENAVGVEGMTIADMTCYFRIDYANVEKSVIASSFTTPDHGMTYPAMPYPLNEIYKILKNIAENETKEDYRKEISTNEYKYPGEIDD